MENPGGKRYNNQYGTEAIMTQEKVIDEVRKLSSPELLDTLYLYVRFLVENRRAPADVSSQNPAPYEDFKSEDEMNEFISAFAKEYFNGL
jgi:hypothetical protein